jgi:hypothetical protein
VNLERLHVKQILRKHDEIRKLSGLEGAFRLLCELGLGGVARIGDERLYLAGERRGHD